MKPEKCKRSAFNNDHELYNLTHKIYETGFYGIPVLGELIIDLKGCVFKVTGISQIISTDLGEPRHVYARCEKQNYKICNVIAITKKRTHGKAS